MPKTSSILVAAILITEVGGSDADADPLGRIAMVVYVRALRDDEVCCFDWCTSG